MKNKLKIILIALFFIISMNNISFADKSNDELSNEKYKVSDETSQNYINRQLEKINISELQEELKDNDIFKNIDLKQFAKDLIKGNAKLSDLINTESLKSLVIDQLIASLKVITMIIVLALLSSILNTE